MPWDKAQARKISIKGETMSKNLLVKIYAEKSDMEYYKWCINVKSPIYMKEGDGRDNSTCVGSGYKTRAGAIKAAKRLLPLFVNAVLEE